MKLKLYSIQNDPCNGIPFQSKFVRLVWRSSGFRTYLEIRKGVIMSFKILDEEKNALGMASRVSLGVYASAEFNTSAVQTQYSASPNFDPNKRTLGFIMALKVNGAKAKQITDAFGITLDFKNEGSGDANGGVEPKDASFPTSGKTMTAYFKTKGDYDSLQGKELYEALAKLRHSIWKKYLEFALAATYAQILPEDYTYAGKSYSTNSFYARQVERDTSHVSFHYFMDSVEFETAYALPLSERAVKQKQNNEVFERARELWSLSNHGGRLVFQKESKCYDSNQGKKITEEFPPKKSALSRYSEIDGIDPQNGLGKPPKPGEPVTMWLLALEDTEQQEFMQMLSDLFGQYTDATGNVIQGSHELANTISGEVARISSESNRLTTEEVKLAELLVDAASYNKEIMIVKVVSTDRAGSFQHPQAVITKTVVRKPIPSRPSMTVR
jgi:hypothetical protein